MKKFIVLALLIGIISNGLLAKSRKSYNRNNNTEPVKNYDYYKDISYLHLSDDYLEEQWYLERIPKEYGDAFLYYTQDRTEMRMHFYSLMVHESNNFKAFVNKNLDGSWDYGPSQLNSNNIKNPLFRELYNPKDESHITSKYCFYMVMSINLYWDLVCKYGYEYAFYAYNGGERTIRYKKAGINQNTSLMKSVTSYDMKVRELIDKHTMELNTYKLVAREMHIYELMSEANFITDNTRENNNTDHKRPALFVSRIRKKRANLYEIG